MKKNPLTKLLREIGVLNIEPTEVTIARNVEVKSVAVSFTEEQLFFLDHFQNLTEKELYTLVKNANSVGRLAAMAYNNKRKKQVKWKT